MANMNARQYETPDNVPWWQLRLAEITHPEGPLAMRAGDDENYRRLLEEEAVAQLDTEVYPDRPELQYDLARKKEAREGYEIAVLGMSPPEQE